MKNKKQKQLEVLDTVIGAMTSLEGKLKTEGSMRVEGKVEGEICCSGDLTVGIEGVAETKVTVRNIIVAGTIIGDVTASGTVHIESTGKLHGNIQMKSFIIDEGGVFEGKSNMIDHHDDRKKEKDKVLEEVAE
ncbi:bactofilin family protein [Virgibacillus sp. DJP39]|uniref:bactofilin family protein n=1 Tax=Virgibacillus sp. DJP39 TaxID=3409790 RepID=UPI003BB6D0A7